MEQITMTNGDATKFVTKKDIRDVLLRRGWTIKGDDFAENEETPAEAAPKRGRKPKAVEEAEAE